MKLLVVNLQCPELTKFCDHSNIGVWLWGRQLSNHPMFLVDEQGNLHRIVITNPDVASIQRIVDELFTGD